MELRLNTWYHFTWTFTDTNNNETICTQDVMVTDNQAPVFDCTSL
ncbi:hypothetical protein RBH94_13185 [Aestuariibaculum sp. YM273]|nr:hypothetical protein [Aestuariibaculum sp. YM273]WMI65009.1 hypothetical protein RBH94_13185 [Aestuariibaculum sp. YM273]